MCSLFRILFRQQINYGLHFEIKTKNTTLSEQLQNPIETLYLIGHIHRFGTGILINSDGVKPVLRAKTNKEVVTHTNEKENQC